MRKWVEKIYIVHYTRRSEGNRSVSFSENEASDENEAKKLAIATCNIRKQNITHVEQDEVTIDLDKLGLAMHERELQHGEKCICDACL